ncbi:prephenate dehydratase [Bacillus sp. H-16]|uniref:prephenate dehydratase n=1 Tax=Alteribacter salitolerans TaxID=2912333 RepID=UPI001962644D|nr:prephenate dehydratase [Alteribacter salitolerans]MBM7097806.1 prephenate dehydratase [Alteribacter salitolerans]
MNVGFLGPAGSFSHVASQTLFPDAVHKPYSTIPDSIDAAKEGQINIAVVPLENTIEGSVNITLDYILHYQKLEIIKELTIPIDQHLMVHPDWSSSWQDEITTVFSHPHAVAQCHLFIRKNLPDAKVEHIDSTAAAAKYVSEHPDEPVAAIANKGAAGIYRLDVVQNRINDYQNNHTRFVALSEKTITTKRTIGRTCSQTGIKTTLVITLPEDHSGALHQVLSAFSWRRLNLTKIESRPMKTGLGNYFFIIDVEKELDDILLPGAIKEIEALGCGVSVLGSYPCYLQKT